METHPAPGNESGQPAFFPVSESKLFWMYLLSFGLYAIYWFYKNWKLQQPRMQKRINAPLRSLFFIFFTHALFRRIQGSARDTAGGYRFVGSIHATLFVLLSLAVNVLSFLSGDTLSAHDFYMLVLLFLSALPLQQAQAAINHIIGDPLGLHNSGYGLVNIVIMVCGGLAWLVWGIALIAIISGSRLQA